MRIVSWNVNSIVARLPRLVAYLEAERPDVVCLQETKVTDDKFPLQALNALGYDAVYRGEKAYNGVAILTARGLGPVERLADRLPDLTYDGASIDESRFLLVRVAHVTIASVYVPNGRSLDHPHAVYKQAFFAALVAIAKEYGTGEQNLVLCGDFNVAPRDEDVHDPAAWAKGVLYHPSMRAALNSLFEAGLVDLLPLHDPGAGRYSWWDYRNLGFVKNHGLRIDLLLASPSLAKRSRAAGVDREMRKGERPSDHVPVWADI